jgi:hypothetical protein
MNELENLIARLLTGEISATEQKALNAILERDPEARRIYVEQCQLHAQLLSNPEVRNLLYAEELIDEASPTVPAVAEGQSAVKSAGAQPWKWIAVSAAVSALVVLGVVRLSTKSAAPQLSESPESVSPETAYQQAEFSESGSLKRPPTNFAVVTNKSPHSGQVSFNRDVRPIFSENCYHCHGPDANTRKAELRLDIEASAFAPHGEFAAPIVRGDPGASPLYQRITSPLKSEIMPPIDSHKSLTDAEKGLIRNWIAQGAKWEGHWAFVPPRKVMPPKSEWGMGPIDAFIFSKQQELGLSPNPRADREVLARRLALDLIGLPATPQQVATFGADQRPNAYEIYVDSLLASPAFGEHQARFWLDAARYADTHGLHLDNYREIWPYRDWVVDAFNRNQPFDEFTVEQIAGDLLPSPTQAQLLATGFSRCSPTTSEGGAIDEEYRAIYAKDRTETVSTVFLGLTVGCAACHDHKFDPITQKDFYQFSAFFNNIDGPIMDGNAYDTRPNLVMPRPQDEASWPPIRDAYQSSERRLDALRGERNDAYEAWLAAGEFAAPEADVSSVWDAELTPVEAGQELLQFVNLPTELATWNRDQPFTFMLDFKIPKIPAGTERLAASKFDGDRGWRLFVLPGDISQPDRYRLRFELIHSLVNRQLISMTTKSRRYIPLLAGKTLPLTVSYDGSGKALGLVLGAPDRLTIDGPLLVDNLQGDFANLGDLLVTHPRIKANAEEEQTEDDNSEAKAPMAALAMRLSLYDSAIPLYLFGHQKQMKTLVETFAQPEADRAKRDGNLLKNYYLEVVDPLYRAAQRAHASLEVGYQFIYDQATISLVMKEREEAAMAHILNRGEYDKKGEEVSAAIPAVLGQMSPDVPRNRLGLARWLVDEKNPLTARVTVNRVWQNLFGTGLVATSEDFGTMGENPSHPELLDWLAVDFRENGWDLKALIKQIVATETYQQDAKIDAAEYAIDTDNRFLARGPRYRLDAEVIRDQALFVGGALDDTRGGPPVKPYQPVGIWNAVAYSGSNTRFYQQDEGPALYRRSLYTFWKRTAPPPNMTIFDAPSRENCTVRRERTNTPLQALILMNDPQFFEAARMLAQRSLEVTDMSVDGRIGVMYRYAFGRAAPETHGKILSESYHRFESAFRQSPEDAAKVVRTGDSTPLDAPDVVSFASLTMVASQIMNLDNFLNKN